MSTGLCAVLASATVAASVPAMAGPLALRTPPVPEAFVRFAPEDAPASVLGLDGSGINNSAATHNLTLALRKAFANRGLSGGEEISLEEMRLTMGCANDEVACLAEGGKTLGVRRLVFGYLRSANGGYELDIQILDVNSGRLEAQATVSVTKADLASDKIDAKAAAIVNELMPAEQADSDLPPRPDPLPETGEPEVEPEPEEPRQPKEGGVWFGLEKPTPRWKWGAFGTTLGLTLAAAGATIVTGVWLTAPDTASFGFRPKLIETGRATSNPDANDPGDSSAPLANNSAFFEVNPDELPPYVDICVYNTHDFSKDSSDRYNQGDPLVAADGGPGARNEDVARICTRGQNIRKWQIGAGVATAVFGVATLAFLGVLLIHKRKPAADAMLRRGFRLGVAPRLDGQGGLSLGGGMRF